MFQIHLQMGRAFQALCQGGPASAMEQAAKFRCCNWVAPLARRRLSMFKVYISYRNIMEDPYVM